MIQELRNHSFTVLEALEKDCLAVVSLLWVPFPQPKHYTDCICEVSWRQFTLKTFLSSLNVGVTVFSFQL